MPRHFINNDGVQSQDIATIVKLCYIKYLLGISDDVKIDFT